MDWSDYDFVTDSLDEDGGLPRFELTGWETVRFELAEEVEPTGAGSDSG